MNSNGLFLELVLEYFLELFDLGADDELAIWGGAVEAVIVLVVTFGGVEIFEGLYGCDDGVTVCAAFI